MYFFYIYLLIVVRDDSDEENAEPTTNLKPEKIDCHRYIQNSFGRRMNLTIFSGI
jgi:hypothetical protein